MHFEVLFHLKSCLSQTLGLTNVLYFQKYINGDHLVPLIFKVCATLTLGQISKNGLPKI